MSDPVEEYRQRVYQKLNLKIRPNMSVLDLGCGDGYDCLFFAQKGAKAIGIDRIKSPEWRKIKSRHRNISFKVADAEKLPFDSESFDLIFAKDVMHHTENPSQFLQEALRLTKKGGKIISIEANRYNPFSYFHMTILLGHEHFKRSEFEEIINSVSGNYHIKYFQFEAHVVPLPKYLRSIGYFLEDIFEKINIIRALLSYNAAIITKKGN